MQRFFVLALATTLAVPACSDSSGPPADENTVAVQDNSFNPSSLTVGTGTTVTWEWSGTALHNVTWVGAGAPNPSDTQSSGTYERTFSTAGTYDYFCSIHGTATTGMRGSVTVP